MLQALHEWIEQLCDPEENFCESLRVRLERGWDAEVEQDARVSCGDKDKYSEERQYKLNRPICTVYILYKYVLYIIQGRIYEQNGKHISDS